MIIRKQNQFRSSILQIQPSWFMHLFRRNFQEKLRDAYRKTTRLKLLKKVEFASRRRNCWYELTQWPSALILMLRKQNLRSLLTFGLQTAKIRKTISKRNTLPIILSIAIKMLSDIQDRLLKGMIDEIVDNFITILWRSGKHVKLIIRIDNDA